MLRALIVEDDRTFRTLFRDELSSEFPSMEMIEAGSGEEALEKLGSHPVDLVFMDIRLPGQNGLEATQRIKTDYPDTTTIVLTIYDLPEYKEAAIRCGASGFVAKLSFEIGEIFTLIKCFQHARHNRRKPACVHFAGGFE